jgi:hypothetical protein
LITRRQALVGAAAGAVSLTVSGARPGAAAPMRLEVVGNRIFHDGRPIRLLGVAMGDPIYIRGNRDVSDYRVVAQEWGANTVRIGLHPGHWRDARAQSIAALARDIAAARAQGLFVILDWHTIGFPGAYTEVADPSWGLIDNAYDTDAALALDFWREMALTYGGDPGILFELWNEPVVDGKLWVSTGQHWPQLKALWERLIAVIRAHSDAIIIAAGERWAFDLKAVKDNLIDDPRVVYAWHVYPNEDRGLDDRWHSSIDGLQTLKPVIVTEWGFCRSCSRHLYGTPEDFGAPFVNGVLEPLRLHSTAWCYSPGAAPQMLEDDGTPSEFGAFAKSYLGSAWRPA